MSILRFVSMNKLKSRGSIKDTDVLRLRKVFYEDGRISREEAEQLFALNDACRIQDSSWPDFFVEALTDYAVHQDEPAGYLTIANADWLIEKISSDGRVESKTELELLIKVIETARWAPTSISAFALAQVKKAVLEGDGPIRSGKSLQPGVIAKAEVELLRRILYAFGGDGSNAISRLEAEVLFDLNDATSEADNDPAWPDLFVKAVANSLMAASGYKAPPREEALRQLEWLKESADLSAAAVLKRVGDGFAGFLKGYDRQSPEERAMARLERQKIEIITNERIDAGEAAWLARRINRDGKLHDNEKALLSFIKRESPQIHPALQGLLDRVAEAA